MRATNIVMGILFFGCREEVVSTEKDVEEEQETETESEDFTMYCDENPANNLISEDFDCDGVLANEDSDDGNSAITASNINDQDCDGIPTALDCDDTDPTALENTNDMDCGGIE